MSPGSGAKMPMLDVATPDAERVTPPPIPPRAAGDALADALAATIETVAAAVADPDPVEMVHDARKAMKQYRALLRLIPGEDAKAERRRTAEVARQLSGARDQVAARDALDVMAQGGFLLACDQTDAAAVLGDDGRLCPTLSNRKRRAVMPVCCGWIITSPMSNSAR